MDIKEASELSQQEERKHWWIKTRFLYIDKAFDYLENQRDINVIEFGCGTAQNLWYLQEESQYKNNILSMLGIDPELPKDFKVDWNKAQNIELSNDLNRPEENKADIGMAMDVLEHIEDENMALQGWNKSLKSNGLMFVTVPAFQALWSYHDEFLDHKRRYTKTQLTKVLNENGFEAVKVTYAFSFIFPLVYLIRKLSKGSESTQDLALPPMIINGILYFCGKVENIFGGFPFFGTSVIGIYRKI
jgi:SAM-dependent methyltransferase